MREFDKVIGYEPIKKELERMLDMMNNKDKYSSLGVKTTRGLLFSGDPGLGKTLMAKCFIKASKRKAFTIRKDKPDGDFVKYIKTVFDKAKKEAPSIVFLDDLDKFANEDENHKNADEFVTVQSCIDDCKDSEVFVLATANELHSIPSSLLREGRFDKKIYFEIPNVEDGEKIVKYYLSSKKVSKDLDYQNIARLLYGKSCACLETVLNEAGVYAAFEGKKEIEMNDIVRSFLRIVYKTPDEETIYELEHLRNIAVHEAGHTVVAEILEPKSINLVNINTSNYVSLNGFANYNQTRDYFYDINNMEKRVITLLAGKAATEVVYGKNDTGCSDDIDRAYAIVARFVCHYFINGFDNRLDGEGEPTEKSKSIIASKLEEYYLKSKQIIIENRQFLDTLVDKLVKDKVVLYNEIQEVKGKCASYN